jgi:hypothetical protein
VSSPARHPPPQAPGDDSEVYLVPRHIFRDPFRGGDNILVLCDAYEPPRVQPDGTVRPARARFTTPGPGLIEALARLPLRVPPKRPRPRRPRPCRARRSHPRPLSDLTATAPPSRLATHP